MIWQKTQGNFINFIDDDGNFLSIYINKMHGSTYFRASSFNRKVVVQTRVMI